MLSPHLHSRMPNFVNDLVFTLWGAATNFEH